MSAILEAIQYLEDEGYPLTVTDTAKAELTRLRTRIEQLEAALAEALEAFQILADAPKEGGWITVAPQFVYANLATLKARLLADEQPADAGRYEKGG